MELNLKTDSQGFLSGEPIKWKDTEDALEGIGKDVGSILSLLSKQTKDIKAAVVPRITNQSININRITKSVAQLVAVSNYQNKIDSNSHLFVVKEIIQAKPILSSQSKNRETASNRSILSSNQSSAIAKIISGTVEKNKTISTKPSFLNHRPRSINSEKTSSHKNKVDEKTIKSSEAITSSFENLAERAVELSGGVKKHQTNKNNSSNTREKDSLKKSLASQTSSSTSRDSKGRFIGLTDEERQAREISAKERGDRQEAEVRARNLIKSVNDARISISDAVTSNSAIDPTISAVKEIGDILSPIKNVATPLARGAFSLLKRGKKDKKRSIWFKKALTALNSIRRDENKWNKKQLQKLKDIENKKESRGSFFIVGILGRILMALLALPLLLGKSLFKGIAKLGLKTLPAILAALARFLKIRRAPTPRSGTRTTTRNTNYPSSSSGHQQNRGQRTPHGTIPERSPASSKGQSRSRVPKLLRRLPWLGALLAAANAYSVEKSDLSREEKTIEHGGNAGYAGGALAGGIVGAKAGALIGAFAGPVGVAIGGVVGGVAGAFFGGEAGQVVGAKLGEWTNQLIAADIPGMIKNAWTSTTSSIENTFLSIGQWWNDASSKLDNIWNDTKKFAGDYYEDAKSTVNNLYDAAGNKLSDISESLKSNIKDKARGASDYINEKTGGTVNPKAIYNNAIIIKNSTTKAIKSTANTIKKEFKESKTYSLLNTAKNKLFGKPEENTPSIKEDVVKKAKVSKSVQKRWELAKSDIVDAADKAGVDAGILANIANFESRGFDPTARPIAKNKKHDPMRAKRLNRVTQFDGVKAISSAHGYGQFIDSTWTESINKWGGKYGIEGAGSLNKKQASKYRNNTKIQAAMLAEFTKENIKVGNRLGGKDDNANVYAMHNLGSGDGVKFLKALKKNPDAKVSSVLSDGVISGNKSLYERGNITLSKAYENMGKVMNLGNVFATDARKSLASKVSTRGDTAMAMALKTSNKNTIYPPENNTYKNSFTSDNSVATVSSLNKAYFSSALSQSAASSYKATAPLTVATIPPPVEVNRPNKNNNRSNAQASISVNSHDNDVGRELSDRPIAHIVTGGFGGVAMP